MGIEKSADLGDIRHFQFPPYSYTYSHYIPSVKISIFPAVSDLPQKVPENRGFHKKDKKFYKIESKLR